MLTETVAGRTYDYSHSVGRGAQTGMGFSNPVAAALGKDDILYVVNRGSESISNVAWNRTGVGGRICKVTLGSQAGEEEFVGEFSKYGDADGQLIWGVGIVADSQGNVYVTDGWLNRVTVFDQEGDYLRHWSAIPGDEGEVNGIAGIAMDADENLYITDGRSHKVRKFTKDGDLLNSWGSLGDGPDQLDSPWGITVDGEGFVYVADFKNHRVQKFTSDGKFVAQFASHGKRRGQINYPVGVAVDAEGDVYICDWSENDWEQGKVHIFDKSGKFLTSLAGDAQQLAKWAQMTVDANADYIKRRREVKSTEPEWNFAQPAGVSFDTANNRLVVMDTQRSRLQIYNKSGGYLVPQLNL
ncbi:MAG: hypothetical protein BZY80_06980 [SAR202 cluster bacterium Io17-Chloro-G2]|nr:MAG: hypothetical protein BZY80_06980 [SAR202 cluster bacterium Io17-Chloro-G2]